MSNTSPADTDQTADIAKSSGLFGSNSPTPQHKTASPRQKRSPSKKSPDNTAQASKSRKNATNTPPSAQPCDSGELDSEEIPPNPAFSTLNLLDTGSVYDALRSSKNFDNKASFAVARVFVRSAKALVKNENKAVLDRYSAAGASDCSGDLRARGEAPTREELISIVSAALRAEKATGSDVKGLTATLQSLLPALFAPTEQSTRPDPAAIIGYITTFAGRKGSEIVQELGGSEFVEARLSEILKVPVKLAEQPAPGV